MAKGKIAGSSEGGLSVFVHEGSLVHAKFARSETLYRLDKDGKAHQQSEQD